MQARDDLKKVLKETQQKSKKEIEKMQQYQDILLKENEAVSKQLPDHQRELAAKVSECDGFSVTNSHLQNELTVLKLQLEDLKGYKAKYESREILDLVKTVPISKSEEFHNALEAFTEVIG